MADNRSVKIAELKKHNIHDLTVAFVQDWLYAHAYRLKAVLKISSLRQDFAQYFYRWLHASFPQTIHNYTFWEKKNFLNAAKDYTDDYDRFQKWTMFMEKYDDSDELGLFLAGKYVTFEKCLFIISRANCIFPKPFLKISGYFMSPNSTVSWNILPQDMRPIFITY